ncbi:hypothetical protein [Pyxidicoccus xibeiensis]|uniref:hypothetical protein n=1 Tax=Pyxidicoccus xibeiensis TaxID=2906759 RepID=UPI0020A7BCDE|nr:hypothetical protein [Pyxidicoccus xibeiensis]MCP3139599.1 hypothetical protein [Pyxidicoccus xibeiensis]
MRFQCEACERLVPLEAFRVEAGVLVVTCDRCGAENRARPPSSPASATAGSASSVQREAAGPGSVPSVQREGSGLGSMPHVQRELTPGAMPYPQREGTGAGAGAAASSSVSSATPMPASARASTPVPVATSVPLAARPSSPALRVVRTDAEAPGMTLPSGASLFEPPPGFCPKCVAPRREGTESCAQCGLVYVNFVADEHQPSEALAGAWRALAEHWDDGEAHDRLMTLAMGRGELAMVGRLYRLRLAWAPEDAMAKRGRDEVVRRATLVVPATAEPAGPSLNQQRLKMAGVAVLFLVVLVLAVFVFQNLRSLMAGP